MIEDGGRESDSGKKSLRILHAVPNFPPDGIGGVGEVAHHLHRSLISKGYHSSVVSSGNSPDNDNVFRVCHSSYIFPAASMAAARLLRSHDVLHVHHGDAIGLLLLSKMLGTPSLCTIHCSCAGIARSFRPYLLDGRCFSNNWQSFKRRWMVNRVRHVLDLLSMKVATRSNFISHFGAREFGYPDDDENVIYNGIPDASILDNRDEHDKTDLLYVGTASHRKRVNILPYLLRELELRLNRPVSLRIIGFDRSSWPEMFEIAAELDLDSSIVCEGPLLSSSLQKFYQYSKLLIVPSAYEGLPLVIGEAQKAGLPCVATDVCAHSEIIINNKNGLLFPLDSIDQLAVAVCRILKDEPLRKSMSHESEERSKSMFCLESQVQKYCRLYHQLAEKRSEKGMRSRKAGKESQFGATQRSSSPPSL